MVHALTVHSTLYKESIARSGSAVLAGCRCAKCGSATIKLAKKRVGRALARPDGYVQISVELAGCNDCGGWERVLPVDALQSKVNRVEVIVDGVKSVVFGSSVKAAATIAGVSETGLRRWITGLGARSLDLFRLYRHRAIIASSDAKESSLLVPFSAFVIESCRRTSRIEPRFNLEAEPTKRKLVFAAAALIEIVDGLGGALRCAMAGAEMFRCAVLLFRGGKLERRVWL